MESFRKAYGALKDSTKVGLAKVNSEFKDLDIAIVKATNHVERPPKERHVRKIFAAVAISRPRADEQQRKTLPEPSAENLLERLPSLQQLLYRLVCCQPEGAARHNFVVQYALALVVKESFKVYCAINDGIINLVDMFFEMPKHNAVKALEIYKKASRQADHLADFYEFCRTLDLAQTFQFPTLRQPPPSFLLTMEDYIKEAPPAGSVPRKKQEDQEKKEEPKKPEEQAPQETEKRVNEVENKEKIVRPQEEQIMSKTQPPEPSVQPVDLLGLDEVNQKADQLEESNALALAIIQPGNDAPQANNNAFGSTSGWELALVTGPSNMNKPQVAETKMAGGFDKSLLDSLYEDDTSRRQLQLHSAGYSTTSYSYETTTQTLYDPRAPFPMHNNVVSPIDTHTAMMPHHHHHQHQMAVQHHHMMMQQQPNMMMMMVPHGNGYNGVQYHYPQQQQQQQMTNMGSSNPFGDPFGGYPQSTIRPPYGNHTLL
ncbi:Putative clathrin assembly protein [Striga hermonthica]|uniref:Clathrin assembly protein n=1 Tax=Striga hermonthica TaxID=68872 RepID=A0A9N7NSV0_STRHE|nr:Putative clathrin assembly protein [Striga hermonthica]